MSNHLKNTKLAQTSVGKKCSRDLPLTLSADTHAEAMILNEGAV